MGVASLPLAMTVGGHSSMWLFIMWSEIIVAELAGDLQNSMRPVLPRTVCGARGAGHQLQRGRCKGAVLAARWSEASITMLTPTGPAALLTHVLPGAPPPVVRSRVGTCAAAAAAILAACLSWASVRPVTLRFTDDCH